MNADKNLSGVLGRATTTASYPSIPLRLQRVLPLKVEFERTNTEDVLSLTPGFLHVRKCWALTNSNRKSHEHRQWRKRPFTSYTKGTSIHISCPHLEKHWNQQRKELSSPPAFSKAVGTHGRVCRDLMKSHTAIGSSIQRLVPTF